MHDTLKTRCNNETAKLKKIVLFDKFNNGFKNDRLCLYFYTKKGQILFFTLQLNYFAILIDVISSSRSVSFS